MSSPNGKVLFLIELITIRGQRKSFQVVINVRIPSVARAGLARGKMMVQ